MNSIVPLGFECGPFLHKMKIRRKYLREGVRIWYWVNGFLFKILQILSVGQFSYYGKLIACTIWIIRSILALILCFIRKECLFSGRYGQRVTMNNTILFVWLIQDENAEIDHKVIVKVLSFSSAGGFGMKFGGKR